MLRKGKLSFKERCAKVNAFDIAKKHEISKDLVDSVVRHRQQELKSHAKLDVVKNGVLANMSFRNIATLSGLEAHEVAWLARRIKAEHRLQLKSLRESETDEHLANIAFGHLAHLQLILEGQTETTSEVQSGLNQQLGTCRKVDRILTQCTLTTSWFYLRFVQTTPDRKELLRWFRTTIAKTIVHRENLKRQHAIKAPHSQRGSHMEEHEFELADAG